MFVVPDTLSRLFMFENEQERTAPKLAPICRNVPDNTNGPNAVPNRPYQVSPNKLNETQPVQSDRELFSGDSNFVSVTKVFQTIDHDVLRQKQAKEYAEYIQYILEDKAPLPHNETATTMSYYSTQEYFTSRICQGISEKQVRFVTS